MTLNQENINEMNSEIKFIKLLNYELVGPDNSNRWLILDENKNNIGYIQKKKTHKKNIKKNLPAVYVYIMNIDSDLIKLTRTREIKNDLFTSNHDYYEFEIKVSETEYANIRLDMGELNRSITIWSEEYGYINFEVTKEKLFLNYKSKTDNYNIEETVDVEDTKMSNSYIYDISYCNKDCDIDNQSKTLSIKFKKEKYNSVTPLIIRQLKFENHKLVDDYCIKCEGTIEDSILEHEMGIDSLNHFKYLMNKIIPLINIEDFISSLKCKKNKTISLFLNSEKKASKVLIKK